MRTHSTFLIHKVHIRTYARTYQPVILIYNIRKLTTKLETIAFIIVHLICIIYNIYNDISCINYQC